MSEEVMSVAVLEPLPGKEEELVATLREFYTMMHAKAYCTDALYRDGQRPDRLFHVRRWKSARDARRSADRPGRSSLLAEVADLCTIPIVYEDLQTLFQS